MTSSTLAQLVNDRPAAARVLERHRLDYCCGGHRTLAQACAETGADPAIVLTELAQDAAGPTSDADTAWTTMGPAALVDHLEATHHRYLHAELPRLTALADKVESAHGARHPELHAVVRALAALRADLEPHLLKEERVLFPMVRELMGSSTLPSFHCGTLANPIRMMLFEHDRAGELLVDLRRASGDFVPPPDACASYRALYAALEELEADTHLHVHKENNVLFPAVLEREARTRPA